MIIGAEILKLMRASDGNKRTAFIAFVIELVIHGFLPSFVERNFLRLKSQAELLQLVLDGMNICLRVLQLTAQQSADPQIQRLSEFYKMQLDALTKSETQPQDMLPTPVLLFQKNTKKRDAADMQLEQPCAPDAKRIRQTLDFVSPTDVTQLFEERKKSFRFCSLL